MRSDLAQWLRPGCLGRSAGTSQPGLTRLHKFGYACYVGRDHGRPSAMASMMTTGIFSDKLDYRSACVAKISALTWSPETRTGKDHLALQLRMPDGTFNKAAQWPVPDKDNFAVNAQHVVAGSNALMRMRCALTDTKRPMHTNRGFYARVRYGVSRKLASTPL